jgi:hypothetical protein
MDGNFPFMHLDRKFMHLGFHIYDVGFQSPNVEAARPLVYATALLLVMVIIGLNLFAVSIRNRLREKYRALENYTIYEVFFLFNSIGCCVNLAFFEPRNFSNNNTGGDTCAIK